ncbi:MAG: DMT family transporter [Chloroflexota bacterium]
MNSLQKSSRLAPLVLLLGILAVSTAAVFIRFAQLEAPSLIIAAYRLGLASLILLPFSIRQARREVTGLPTVSKFQTLLAGIFLAVHFAAWITSLELTSVASSVVLVTTTPLWVAIFSPLFLKERMRKEVWWGLGLALSGGVVVAASQTCAWEESRLVCASLASLFQGKALLGNFLALMGAWMAAGYLLVGRKVRPLISLRSYILLVYSTAAVILIGLAIVNGYSFTGYSLPVFGWFFLLAFIPQVIGHSSFNWALRYLPAAFVSLALLGEPVGATILAMIFLREMPLLNEVIGGGMILGGIYLASLANRES